MDGFKLIKTTFGTEKEIIGVNFNGDETYNLFLEEIKNVYNIPETSHVQVYSKDFVVKPNIFVYFVAQYMNNLDFVLDIKVKCPAKKKNDRASNTEQMPSTEELADINEIKELLNVKRLENIHRTRIAKAIISSILAISPDKRLLREEFLHLAEAIVQLFPTEVRETYYVPFSKGNLATGKLYNAYNNKRAILSSSGIIQRRLKFKPQPIVVFDDSNILSDSDVDEDQLEIIKSGCADWNVILEIWRKSYSFRKNEYKAESLDTMVYMEKYKVLQHEKNYELFEIDYQISYPQSKRIYEWKFYHNQVINKAEKLRDNFVKDILTDIENTWDEESKLALSLLLVPYLLPTSRQKSKSKVQECFISYSKNVLKQENNDDDSYHIAKSFKLDHHPKIYFIGDQIEPISFAYLDFFGRRHIFQDPLRAVEACFHCFLASNIRYPKYCEHVWLFVQKLIFQVNTPDDVTIPSTNTLINDLQQLLPVTGSTT